MTPNILLFYELSKENKFYEKRNYSTCTGNVIRGSHHTPMSPLLKSERTLDLFAGLLYLFRWIAIPVIRTGSLSVLISVR